MEDVTFAVGFGLSKAKNIDETGRYRNVAIDGSVMVKRFLFNMSASPGWNVRESEYGSGGLSDKHSLIGINFGYIIPHQKFAIAPLVGVCFDQTYYNDLYYDNAIGKTENFLDYGASLMYTYNRAIFSLKVTRCFPVGLSVYLIL